MSFCFTTPRARRRPGLTPLIDVVFLLLVFFMLASQFGREHTLAISPGGMDAKAYSGPPRLVTVLPEALRLNGREIDAGDLLATLDDLTETREDPIILQPRDDATLQRLTTVLDALSAAGFTGIVLVE